MKTLSLNMLFWILFLINEWLTGCSGVIHRHMNDPVRYAWQKPQVIIAKLAIKPGATIADLGAGGGYFTWRLSETVGLQGKVYALDINATALEMIKKEIKARSLINVFPILAKPNDAKLPEPVDLIFCSDTYHHIQNPADYFRALQKYLKPTGRIAILDFHPHGFFSGLLGHGSGKAEVRREMELAGYRLVAGYDIIDRQHFQIFSTEKP